MTKKPEKQAEKKPEQERIWKGNEVLGTFLVPIAALKIDPENARRHTMRSLKALSVSLDQFGQQTPIVVDKGKIVRKGNGTVMAARDTLGWTHVAAVITDIEGDKVKIYSLGDNRTSELSVWDAGILAGHVQSLFQEVPQEVWGSWWEDYELQPLMDANLWTPPAAEEEDGKELFNTKPGAPIKVTGEQRLTIDRAIAQVRASHSDPEMSDGRCIELICAEYLS